jgi:hypothetical protein
MGTTGGGGAEGARCSGPGSAAAGKLLPSPSRAWARLGAGGGGDGGGGAGETPSSTCGLPAGDELMEMGGSSSSAERSRGE